MTSRRFQKSQKIKNKYTCLQNSALTRDCFVSQNDFVDEDDFLKAALEDKLPVIKSYLARGADPNARDSVSVYPTY